MITSSSVTASSASSMRCCQFCPQAISLRSWKIANSSPGLRPHLGGQPFPELGQLPVIMLVIEPDIAHERRRPDRHRHHPPQHDTHIPAHQRRVSDSHNSLADPAGPEPETCGPDADQTPCSVVLYAASGAFVPCPCQNGRKTAVASGHSWTSRTASDLGMGWLTRCVKHTSKQPFAAELMRKLVLPSKHDHWVRPGGRQARAPQPVRPAEQSVDHSVPVACPTPGRPRAIYGPEARSTDRYAVTLRRKAERLTSAFDEQHK